MQLSIEINELTKSSANMNIICGRFTVSLQLISMIFDSKTTAVVIVSSIFRFDVTIQFDAMKMKNEIRRTTKYH